MFTEEQKRLARWIVTHIRSDEIRETFIVDPAGSHAWAHEKPRIHFPFSGGTLNILHEEHLIFQEHMMAKPPQPPQRKGAPALGEVRAISVTRCTVRKKLYEVVDSDFAEPVLPPVALAVPSIPVEISSSLSNLQNDHPNPAKLGFLIMRFAAITPLHKIVDVIQTTAKSHGITIMRADGKQYHDDLLANIQTYLHGCGFAIAVYERIKSDEPNANVGLEVGYMLALRKPVLLLNDNSKGIPQPDLAGRLYHPFDVHDPEGTIPKQMEKWMSDKGIIVKS